MIIMRIRTGDSDTVMRGGPLPNRDIVQNHRISLQLD